MTNKELQTWLKKYPANTEIRVYYRKANGGGITLPMELECMLETSDSDTINEESDTNDVIKGNGPRYILLNAPVL